jgi:hypothetical protein
MARARSWALGHFHTEELRKGSAVYLLCRSCFPIGRHRPSSEELKSIKDPGKEYNGCIRYCWGLNTSPTNLAAHARRHCLEDPAAVRHDKLSEGGGERGDEDTTQDFVRYMVVLDLADFASAQRKGATHFYQKHLRGRVFGRTKIKNVFDNFAAAGMKKVKDIVAARKKAGGKFTMSTDAWKTKGRRKQSYLAVILSFVDPEFQLQELCAGILPMDNCVGPKSKNHAYYAESLNKILKDVGVALTDLVAVVSDHDAPLRKAIKTVLKLPAIGCQCHAMQLPLKHVLPPLNKPTPCVPAAAPNAEDAAAESSAEEAASEDAAAAADAPAAAHHALKFRNLRKTDPERVRLIERITPIAQKIRTDIKWYIHHPDDYDCMTENAKIDACSFSTECKTRWDTTLLSWCSYLRNMHAMRMHRQKFQGHTPVPMLDKDADVVADLCTVMTPIRRGSMMMQRNGTRSSASMCIPVILGVLRQLGPEIKELPLPVGCGRWSGPKGGDAKKKVADLAPIAKRLRDWLHADLQKVFKKHATDFCEDGYSLMKAASFLDPRFKNAKKYMSEEDLQTTKHFVYRKALQRAEAFPVFARFLLPESKKRAATDPDTEPLSSLVPAAKSKSGRGTKKQKHVPAAPSGPSDAREATLGVASSERARPSAANDILYTEMEQTEAGDLISNLALTIKRQLAIYEQFPEARKGDEDVDPLAWWRDRALQMPHLAQLALDLFSIPGSSHALERAFSRAGRGVDPRRRARLRKDSAAKLIFCHENCIRSVF